MSDDDFKLGDIEPVSVMLPGLIPGLTELRRDRAIASLVLQRDWTIQHASDSLQMAMVGLDALVDRLKERAPAGFDDPDFEGAFREAVEGLDGLVDSLSTSAPRWIEMVVRRLRDEA
jgi:hypothetical protein